MPYRKPFLLGDWRVTPASCEVAGPGGVQEVEPKVMDLLCLLAEAGGEVVTRETVSERIWPGVTVNEDAMGRCVWKLRRALGDPARNPRYVGTVPKRGYRLLEPVRAMPVSAATMARVVPNWIWGVLGALLILIAFPAFWLVRNEVAATTAPASRALQLVDRAEGFYYQFEFDSNEAAMRLYEAALALEADNPAALAGLANTITQRVIRGDAASWASELGTSRIGQAVATGLGSQPDAARRLARAEALARRAVAAEPDYALGYRAVGLALSAQGALDAAIEAYNQALTIDPDAWEAWINLSDLHRIRGDDALALTYLERAYEAMGRVYETRTVLVRPWYSPTGLLIARRHAERADPVTAELWYRRVLYWDPYNRDAMAELAALLRSNGDGSAADALCAEGIARIGDPTLCEPR
ncbi:winged helix-turn-helix domain-containing protein [Maricaulis sp.]|uniref:winged helix-turn-helix domain-containing protein n=1 Tax=Maricaulis sp. TaxID=1486257 RepID=UPI0025C17697|nr:winged helix-turn-helix domain-containing protein [Maricaulis sp.]